MSQRRRFQVKHEDIGSRLDLYLAKHNNDISRTKIKEIIEQNKVIINGEVEYKANFKVQSDDIIEFDPPVKESNKFLKPQNIPIKIIYEDDYLLVIDKQSGMVVHPGSGHSKDTLVNAILYYYKDFDKFEDKVRSGLIHRIDKNTSGIILVAKNNEALNYYTKQFANRNVEKQYLCVAYGQLPNELGYGKKMIVQNFMARSKSNRKKYQVVQSGGKYAHSEFELISSDQNYHLINANIKTGRTHQIRVHLASKGIPVLGDEKYGRKKYKRLMLHARRLKIEVYKSKLHEFEAKIPLEFRELFSNVK